MDRRKALNGRTRRTAALLLTLILSLIVTPVTLAEVTSSVDANGVLTVTSDGDDDIVIWSSDGKVWINGFSPDSGEIESSDITMIIVRGGPGDNHIDLSGVSRDEFPNLSDGDVETWGEGGNDTMIGSEFGDYQNGGDGDDTQHGGDGGDWQDGGDGNDTQNGGTGNDTQNGGDGGDWQDGGDGDDTQNGDFGNDFQEGGSGNDSQTGGAGDDEQVGGAGDDEQDGGVGDDLQDGGDGDDEQNGSFGNDRQNGDAGNDEQNGGEGNDEQNGGDDHDFQSGGQGNDCQIGGEGNDEQQGDAGDDVQEGGEGNDEQWGGAGDDTQDGGDGNDIQFGGEGHDTCLLYFGSADVVNDEAGDDTLDASEVTSPITIDLDLQDVDQVVDAAGNTLRLEGQFETFIGGPFPDVVSAGPLTVPRSIDGGGSPPTATLTLAGTGAQEGDTLNFDAQGLPVADTGTALIVEGFAPVTYTNFVTVTITNAGVDLSLGKAAEPEAVIPGERLTYTLTITNAGPTTPISATVVDTFSDAGALADVTSDGDCTWSPGSAIVTCTVTDIVSGTPAHLTLGVTSSISASGVLSNTAIVTPTGGVMDVNANNNVAGPVEVRFKRTIYLPLVLRNSCPSIR